MNSASDDSARDCQLEEILHTYLQAVDAGKPPDRDALLRQRPEFAAEIAAFFANQDAVAELARGMVDPVAPAAGVGEAPTLAPGETLAPSPGTRLRYFGDYESLEEIARGGMGVVFKARQVSLNRQVAIKMILAGQLASPQDVQRFHTEAEAAANLDHPHIVPIYEVGQHEGQHYFSMKLIEGGSLGERMERLRGDPRAAARLLQTAARAVHYAHQRGILHRDLKPSNILLDAKGEPHVTDFGLAKRVEGGRTQTLSGAIVGTPSYMAPEQARGEKGLSTAVDTYSLGAILYECLTGQPPFRAATPLDTILLVLEREPAHPRGLNDAADRDLATIALKCLEKVPTRRYESAAALADDLELWLAGEPILARPSGWMEAVIKWTRRRPAVAALLATLAVTFLGGSITISLLYLQAERQKEVAQEERDDADRERIHAVEKEQVAKVAEFRARHYWYDADINLAQQAMESSKGPRLLGYLQRQQPQPGQEDLRGFDWYYLWWLSHPEKVALEGHTQTVTCVAYSPDGRFLATGSGDLPHFGKPGEVKIWDSAKSKLLQTIGPFPNGVSSLAFSPDGKILATGTGLSQFADLSKKPLVPQVKLWDIATGREKMSLPSVTAPVVALVFTLDGKTLVLATPSWFSAGKSIKEEEERGITSAGVELWNLATGRQKPLVFKTKGVFVARSLALSADGKTLAAGGISTTFPADLIHPGPGRPDQSALAEDVARIASMAMSGVVNIWDMDSGQEKQQLKCPGWINAVAFAPGATTLGAACQDNTIRLWDVRTGAETAKLTGHAYAVSALAFSPNGKVLASGSQDRSLVLWDLASSRKQATLFGHSGPVESLAYAPDGKTLASGGVFAEVFVWKASDPRARIVLRDDEGTSRGVSLFVPVAFSPDGKLLAMASGKRIILWDCQRMAKRVILDESDKQDRRVIGIGSPFESIVSLTFAPDGKTLASKRVNHISLWDVLTGKKQKEYPLENGMGSSGISFAPDGRYIQTAGMLLEVATGKIDPFLRDGTKLSQIAFAPDGHSVAGMVFSTKTPAETLAVYDEQTRRAKFTLKGHEVADLAFSPDGQLLVSAGADGRVGVWNVVTGELQAQCIGHLSVVYAVAISSDEQTIASASADGSVKLWDPITGQERLTLSHDGRSATSVAFSPDGQMLAVGWGMDQKNPLSSGEVTVYRAPRP